MIGLLKKIKKTDGTLEPKKNRPVKVGTSQNKIEPAQNIPEPKPPGMGAEYERIWKQAWRLADFIDGDTAPYADRKKRLPELLMMRDRMAGIEWQYHKKTGPDPVAPERWSEFSTEGRVATGKGLQHTHGYCPAKCKKTGLCFGKTYYTGKPGKFPGQPCNPKNCKWE